MGLILKEKPSTTEVVKTPFYCKVCDRYFKNDFSLQGHLKAKSHPKPDAVITPEAIKEMPKLDVKASPAEPMVWVKKNGKKHAALTPCFIIDKNNKWHNSVPINLGDINPEPFTWGYYGVRRPLLIENGDKLEPYYVQMDLVGESCNRVYKAGHPDGFKNTFKHTSSLLQKIQIGLMAVIVIAIFFLIYILINR